VTAVPADPVAEASPVIPAQVLMSAVEIAASFAAE
jgi:hypothetical protein